MHAFGAVVPSRSLFERTPCCELLSLLYALDCSFVARQHVELRRVYALCAPSLWLVSSERCPRLKSACGGLAAFLSPGDVAPYLSAHFIGTTCSRPGHQLHREWKRQSLGHYLWLLWNPSWSKFYVEHFLCGQTFSGVFRQVLVQTRNGGKTPETNDTDVTID